MKVLIWKSLRHYWRSSLAVFAGVCLTSAVLTGALSVGDSVRAGLRDLAGSRTGQATHALVGNDRFFRAALGQEMGEALGVRIASLLQVDGTAADATGSARANGVRVLGVDAGFSRLSPSGEEWDLERGEAALSAALASRLAAEVGDEVLLRVERPGAISRDAPLSGSTDETETLRLRVIRLVSDRDFGRFSLAAEQVPPLNAFVSRDELGSALDKAGRANLALFAAAGRTGEELSGIAGERWTLDDADAALAPTALGLQLSSRRVLIDSETERLARAEDPAARGVFTYLINTISKADRSTPYSMVAGVEAGAAPGAVVPEAGKAILSPWLAEDLAAQPGDEITLSYYVFAPGRRLEEQDAKFMAQGILTENHEALVPAWTPGFPGVSDAENCRDWDPGIPVELDRIRDKDEEYWDIYKGTPKAFIRLDDAQPLWSNRFGNLTSLLFSGEMEEETLRGRLDAAALPGPYGVDLVPVQEEAEAAVRNSLDLGQYLAYFSFFLILAGLILTALLFVFGLDQRREQIGLLMALGFPASRVRNLFLIEGGVLSLLGAAAGIAGGVIFAWLAMRGLETVWKGAAAGIPIRYAPSWISLVAGALGVHLLAMLAIVIAGWGIRKESPARILGGGREEIVRSPRSFWRSASFWCVPLTLTGAGLLLAGAGERGAMAQAGAFFGAGGLLLIGGLCAAAFLLRRAGVLWPEKRNLPMLGLRNAGRRRGRSLAVLGMMAAGVFMITAVNSFRLDAARETGRRDGGTGGFAFVGESSLAVYEDLDRAAGREAYNLDEDSEFSVVSFRVRDGEEASCLNLNRAQKPRLMAVDPAALAGRGAFAFANVEGSLEEGESPWLLLEPPREAEDTAALPAIMDQNSALYALGLQLGDTLEYEDDSGRSFSVRLAGLLRNSVLQGNVIIAEDAFLRKFPGSGGYRYFLVEGEAGDVEEAGRDLTRMLESRGLALTPAALRLAEFNQVQNTYLQIFSTLGGLGLALGAVGLGVVLARNMMERRGELALMQAVGFTRTRLSRLVLAEHWFLHLSAVGLGLTAALLAVAPVIGSAGQDFPAGLLSGLVGAILFGGLAFCWLAARWTMRQPLLESLRNE
ncbi:MAG TPA: ABC transporter permease [Verrucomicrobiales bacterium]|nr:ABC transporter permease [Verrucomicrobiales bacterium]